MVAAAPWGSQGRDPTHRWRRNFPKLLDSRCAKDNCHRSCRRRVLPWSGKSSCRYFRIWVQLVKTISNISSLKRCPKLFTDKTHHKNPKNLVAKHKRGLCGQTVTWQMLAPKAEAKSSSLRRAAKSPAATSQTKLFPWLASRTNI